MADVVCLGEALIDLIPTDPGLSLAAAPTFLKAAGGAPANVAAGVARLGAASAFIGMVGDDGFGSFLVDTLSEIGVVVTGVCRTAAAPTALAAVSLRVDGERDFIFYGSPAAHRLLAPADIDAALVRGARILHFGSISLIGAPARDATLHAVEIARAAQVLISYDPNLRRSLWRDDEAARAGMQLGLEQAEIVKISEDEVAFLAGGSDLLEAARSLWHARLRLMAVTRGADGVLWLTGEAHGAEPGFPVIPRDTTGAGDAFMAALLTGIVAGPETILDPARVAEIVRFACAAAALSTTRLGAIAALPDRAEVVRFLAQRFTVGRSAAETFTEDQLPRADARVDEGIAVAKHREPDRH